MALDDKPWRDPENNFFKPTEKGESVAGQVVDVKTVNDQKTYEIELLEEQSVPVNSGDDGKEIKKLQAGASVLVNYSTLQEFLKKHRRRGNVVYIEYEGDETAEDSGHDYKTFTQQWLPLEEYEEA